MSGDRTDEHETVQNQMAGNKSSKDQTAGNQTPTNKNWKVLHIISFTVSLL